MAKVLSAINGDYTITITNRWTFHHMDIADKMNSKLCYIEPAPWFHDNIWLRMTPSKYNWFLKSINNKVSYDWKNCPTLCTYPTMMHKS